MMARLFLFSPGVSLAWLVGVIFLGPLDKCYLCTGGGCFLNSRLAFFCIGCKSFAISLCASRRCVSRVNLTRFTHTIFTNTMSSASNRHGKLILFPPTASVASYDFNYDYESTSERLSVVRPHENSAGVDIWSSKLSLDWQASRCFDRRLDGAWVQVYTGSFQVHLKE